MDEQRHEDNLERFAKLGESLAYVKGRLNGIMLLVAFIASLTGYKVFG